MPSPFLLRSIARGLVWERRIEVARARAKSFRTGFLVEGLTPTERDVLGAMLYDASPDNRRDDLFPWEQRWFDVELPAPVDASRKLRILAGGVGAGREVVALLARGYDVVAFEPSDDMAAIAEKKTGLTIVRATYRDLCRAVNGDVDFENAATSSLRALLADAPVDGVLLGWGSLSHLLDDDDAAELLQACAVLCPHGPILTSFLSTDVRARRGDRFQRWGQKSARIANRLRGRASTNVDAIDIVFDPSVGFLRFWDAQRLRSFLPERKMDYVVTPYPHASFHAGPDSNACRADRGN